MEISSLMEPTGVGQTPFVAFFPVSGSIRPHVGCLDIHSSFFLIVSCSKMIILKVNDKNEHLRSLVKIFD